MIRYVFLPVVLALAACGSKPIEIDGSAKLDLDCVAAQSVVAIVDAVRTGSQSGAPAEELDSIDEEEIARAVERISGKYGEPAHATYLEAEIQDRLSAIQNALSNRDPGGEDADIWPQTKAFAETCRFEG